MGDASLAAEHAQQQFQAAIDRHHRQRLDRNRPQKGQGGAVGKHQHKQHHAEHVDDLAGHHHHQHRQKAHQVKLAARKHQRIGQQQAKDRARGTDRRPMQTGQGGHRQLRQSGRQYAGREQLAKALLAPQPLQFAAKHPQAQHVEQQVAEVGVQEGVAQQLPGPEIAAAQGPEREQLVHRNHGQEQLQAENCRADDHQRLGDRGQWRHGSAPGGQGSGP